MLRVQGGVFCDVVIRAGDHDFPVHRCVLSAVSRYFKAMFTTSLSESSQDCVTLNGISPAILDLLFGYAYTAEVKITKNNVQNLLAAANLLGESSQPHHTRCTVLCGGLIFLLDKNLALYVCILLFRLHT